MAVRLLHSREVLGSIPGRNLIKKILTVEDFHFMFFWTLRESTFENGRLFSALITFYSNPFGRGVKHFLVSFTFHLDSIGLKVILHSSIESYDY